MAPAGEEPLRREVSTHAGPVHRAASHRRLAAGQPPVDGRAPPPFFNYTGEQVYSYVNLSAAAVLRKAAHQVALLALPSAGDPFLRHAGAAGRVPFPAWW